MRTRTRIRRGSDRVYTIQDVYQAKTVGELRTIAHSLGFPWEDTENIDQARLQILRFAT